MRISVFFLSAIAAFLLSSCIDLQEEITLHKNGSGTYRFTMDLGQLLTFMELEDLFKEIDGFAEEDIWTSTETEISTTDSEQFNWFQDVSGTIDTVILFTDRTSEHADILDRSRMRMQVDKEQSKYLLTLEVDFNHVSEINDFFEALDTQGESPFAGLIQQQVVNEDFFNWSKRKLIRKKPNNTTSGETIKPEDLEMAQLFFSRSKYTTIYNLPGKVKSTTIPNAQIAGKRVTIENSLIDLMAGEVEVFGEINFKRR